MAPQPTSGAETDIQRPLMLVMPVAIARLDELKTELQILEDPKANALLTGALDKVGLVHFTRFVLLEDVAQGWAKLIVDAIFDGPVPAYIAAFARELNWIFN